MSILSIIIPTYNSAKTLAACLDSIVCQTFQDYEVWLIDAVSSDTTLDIISAYAVKYPNIKFISEPDQGIYDAMNKGIDLAKGEWLYFLGSDDSLFNLNILDNIFSECGNTFNNSHIVYGDVIFKEWHTISRNHQSFHIFDFINCNLNHQSIFYNKKVFELIGNYNLAYKVFADWEFNIRCFYSSVLVHSFINKIIAYYSVLGISNQKSDTFYKYKLALIESFLTKKNLSAKLDFFIYRNKHASGLYLILVILAKILKRVTKILKI